ACTRGGARPLSILVRGCFKLSHRHIRLGRCSSSSRRWWTSMSMRFLRAPACTRSGCSRMNRISSMRRPTLDVGFDRDPQEMLVGFLQGAVDGVQKLVHLLHGATKVRFWSGLLRNLVTDGGKDRIRVQALQEIVLATLDTHVVPGLHSMLPDLLVQGLTVSRRLHAFHHPVFRR